MDPATLYILYKLADGSERTHEQRFESVTACEKYVVKVQNSRAQVVRYRCANVFKMEPAPVWYVESRTEKLIHGVPVDPRHSPRHRVRPVTSSNRHYGK